ncbi:gliding motility-associated C-terminal domain-containing protein [Salibacter sp.]|uniref:T9SS type B sorting domain-containing protein n=1 Tax=Salibacter sp. TaxID=2010995 RepID=UPI0028709362|nr:gliding motility-associated C-terminal domain-containing protein [Salibacter sp.]MDR9397587.1 gliding motility-associated C-terminal domain-containing protein [Salibacter sp.]MDR9487003.1 gliding motility-associated C-terminal domain-containing protein [Salibacter sp.]
MSNELNNFEKEVRKAMENYEGPRRDNAWDDLQQRMDAAGSGSASSKAGSSALKFGLLAVVAAAIGFAVNYDWSEPNTNPDNQTEQVVENNQQSDEVKDQNNQVEESNEKEVASPSEPAKSQTDEKSEVSNEAEPATEATQPVSNKEQQPDGEPGSDRENSSTNTEEEQNSPQLSEAKTAILTASKSVVCKGEQVSFELSNGKDFKLKDSEGRVYDQQNLSFTTEGAKQLVAVFSSGETQPIEVKVEGKPTSNFTYSKELIDGGRPHYVFENQSNGGAVYRWIMNDKVVAQQHDYSAFLLNKGSQNIGLITLNDAGCADTNQQVIFVEESYNLLAPDAFTPNGDGKNDAWLPVALENPAYRFELEVLDQNNNVVFRTSDPSKKWEGPRNIENLNRTQLVFFWRAVVYYEGQRESYGGTIQVIP